MWSEQLSSRIAVHEEREGKGKKGSEKEKELGTFERDGRNPPPNKFLQVNGNIYELPDGISRQTTLIAI